MLNAPVEQYSSDISKQGAYTDLYAIGAVLYRLAAGHAPVESQDRGNALIHGEANPYIPVKTAASITIDKSFAEAIDTMTQKSSSSSVVKAVIKPVAAKNFTDLITGMEFIRVSAGSFKMGSPKSEKGRDSDEQQHSVHLSKDYYLGKYEVTQGQWQIIMSSNPSKFKKGDNHPVEQVSWDDIQKFIKKLNTETKQAGYSYHYRLPTEAEWEYQFFNYRLSLN